MPPFRRFAFFRGRSLGPVSTFEPKNAIYRNITIAIKYHNMHLLLFETDIRSKKKVRRLTTLLNGHSDILRWSVDLEDIDNVLRIEANVNLMHNDVISIIKNCGFYIEELKD